MFVAYAALTPPFSADKDSAEFALVLATHGIAHPTGYPLFTFAGHLFVQAVHALGAGWPLAANLWAGVGGAVAMLLLQRLALALLPAEHPGGRVARFALSLLPVAWFAFNPLWTYEATLAEVYSWHVAWGLGAALFFAHAVRRMSSAPLVPMAVAWGLLCGLGMAHHATAGLLILPCSLGLLVALVQAKRTNVLAASGLGLLAVAASVLPLSSYLLILWRETHTESVQWPPLMPGWAGLWEHVSGKQYWRLLGKFEPSRVQVDLLARYLWPFLWAAIAVQLAAWPAAKGPRARLVRGTLFLAAALMLAHVFSYGAPDPSSYFLLPFALAIASLPALLAAIAARSGTLLQGARFAAAGLGIVAIGFWWPWWNAGRDRVELFGKFDSVVRAMWNVVPADHAFVFWTNDMYALLHEYQRFEQLKPGVEVYNATSLTWSRSRARFAARHGFDPGEGYEEAIRSVRSGDPDSVTAAVIQHIETRVNALSPWQVVHFDPAIPTVRLLRKPGAAPADSAR
ncbi:MAG: DUF2723 domain-containing protein [Candidatus Eisenbacteria bacterium]